jgi:GNAT superfamily N-acetyltransferase
MEIKTGFESMDFDRVHTWLASAYWSPGVPRDRVERAARHSSLVVGAFEGDVQVGYMRVVSDRTTFAWVCDVYVDEAHRGKGIARQMVAFALADPEHEGLRRWILATRDAHHVYASVGFDPLEHAQRWMIKGQQLPQDASGSQEQSAKAT